MMSVGWRLLLLINKSCIQNTDNMYCRVLENCIMSFCQHRLSVFGIKAYHKWVYLILCCLIVALDVSCDSVIYLVWILNVVLYRYIGQGLVNVDVLTYRQYNLPWENSLPVKHFHFILDQRWTIFNMHMSCTLPLYFIIVDRIPCMSCRQGLKLTVISPVNAVLNVFFIVKCLGSSCPGLWVLGIGYWLQF